MPQQFAALLMGTLLDPGFKLIKTCFQLSVHMLMQLIEPPILPFQPEEIVRKVEKSLNGMEKNDVTKTVLILELEHLRGCSIRG